MPGKTRSLRAARRRRRSSEEVLERPLRLGLRRLGHARHGVLHGAHRRGSGGAVYPAEESGTKVYFDTDDIDASIAKVRDGGGTADDKQPIPHVGWFAHCKDTEGNTFSLFQSDESVAG